MYRTTLRLQAEEREAEGVARPGQKRLPASSPAIAVAAAVFSQLHGRDTVVVEGESGTVRLAADEWFPRGKQPALHSLLSSSEECSLVAAGIALRAKYWSRTAVEAAPVSSTPQPVVVAMLRSFPALTATLELIRDHDLSLLLLVSGALESRAESQRRLAATDVPILLVDDADAVAVCRAMQECLLRARSGWGGAVLQAAAMPGAGDPVHLLEQHLQRCGISVTSDAPFAQVD